MNWQMLELELDGVLQRLRYRVIGHMMEVETRFGRRRVPAGPLRAEVTAANVLRQMARRQPQAA
jgi:hypothetical protein